MILHDRVRRWHSRYRWTTPAMLAGAGCDGRTGGDATSTGPKPATTSDKPGSDEDYEVRLEYRHRCLRSADCIQLL